MRVFAVSGQSGTGKTTLVEALIKELVKEGHSVATLKSSKHDPGPEQGTDTWRHSQAGASVTLFLKTDEERGGLRERIGEEDLARLVDYDFLLIEGLKSEDIPRFWCIGANEDIPVDVPVNTQAIVRWEDGGAAFQDYTVIDSASVKELVRILIEKAVDISSIE
jgi:molybdopterin-guanine dinucleotide biosynthesis protein MobB